MKFRRVVALLLMVSVLMSQSVASVMAEEENKTYVIVDVFDHYDGTSMDIEEIMFLNAEANFIEYDVVVDSAYDSTCITLEGWNDVDKKYNKLKDNQLSSNIGESVSLGESSSPGDGSWVRFVLSVNKMDCINHFIVRTNKTNVPKEITFYVADSYDFETNIKERSNEGLAIVNTLTLSPNTENYPLIMKGDASSTIINNGENLKLNGEVDLSLELSDVISMQAEKFTIEYDDKALKYVSAQTKESSLVVIDTDTSEEGKITFILASTGGENCISGDNKNILDIKFKSIASGKTEVKLTNGEYADGYGYCSTIGDSILSLDVNQSDVDNNSEFNFIDLAIAARFVNSNKEDWGRFNPDVDSNGVVDLADLQSIAKQMK